MVIRTIQQSSGDIIECKRRGGGQQLALLGRFDRVLYHQIFAINNSRCVWNMGLYGATNVCDRRSQDTSITISNQHINDIEDMLWL